MPAESVLVELAEEPERATDTSVIPDTTPEMVYPELVLVLELVLVDEADGNATACEGVLLVDDAELPESLHAAREMHPRKTSAVNKRDDRNMSCLLPANNFEARVVWEKQKRRKVSL